jgi:hypothetical protein
MASFNRSMDSQTPIKSGYAITFYTPAADLFQVTLEREKKPCSLIINPNG